MNNNILFNYNFLLIHEEHLRAYSLYRLYILRCKIFNLSENFNVNVMNKIIKKIDNVINDKPKGYLLMKILNNISYLTGQLMLMNYTKYNLKYKYIQLQIYEYKNQCEDIFNIPIDSTLNFKEKVQKYYYLLNIYFNIFIKNLLECKIKF